METTSEVISLSINSSVIVHCFLKTIFKNISDEIKIYC